MDWDKQSFEDPQPTICHALMQNPCAFTLSIALPCPVWEPNVPLGIDAGTAPGHFDVIRAGQVTPSWHPDCRESSITGFLQSFGSCAGIVVHSDNASTVFYFKLASG